MRGILVVLVALAVIGFAYAQVNEADDMDAMVDDEDNITETIDEDDIDVATDNETITAGVTRQEEAFGPLDVVIDVDAGAELNEVAVCTTPEKDNGYVIASVGSAEQIDSAIDVAQDLFNSIATIGNETAEDVLGSRHFGCLREELANATIAANVTTTETVGTAGNVTAADNVTAGPNATAGTPIGTTPTGTTAGQTTGTTGTATGGGGVTY